MKISDIMWFVAVLVFSLFVVLPTTHRLFVSLTVAFPYGMGFIKTAYLATLGEMLVHRFKTGQYRSQGLHLKALLWGIFGMIFVFIFKIFAEGVNAAQTSGLLPTLRHDALGPLLTALLISTIMNLFFAPSFMLFHRITDQYIELGQGRLNQMKLVKMSAVINHIDFQTFVSFVIFKTIPFFWIPAHTITFLLPEQYRILMAAYLSIALGIILTIQKQIKLGHIRTG